MMNKNVTSLADDEVVSSWVKEIGGKGEAIVS